jgi:glycosyltransferase involved in cell wall biosynthesis
LDVFVVNPSLFAPFYDYHLCRALADLGHSVTMIGRPLRQYERRPEGSFESAGLFYRLSDRNNEGRPTSKVGQALKGFEHAAGLAALENLARRKGADVVHFQWLVVPLIDRWWIARMRRRCGMVLTVHNAEVTTHSPGAIIGRVGGLFHSIGQRSAVLGFDRFVVHSARTFDRLRGFGIAADRIAHLQHPPLELRPARNTEPGAPRTGRTEILFFGSIKPYKGVDILVAAGLKMATTRRDFRITIAGQPFQPIDDLQTRIAESRCSDLFRFDLNYIPDEKLADYIAQAAIVVFPYREIDGSGALSHALRLDKPIVASNVGGFAESPFAEHLSLVPPNDPSALASRLGELIADPSSLEELRRKSAQLRSRLPSWADYARACQSLYEEIAPARLRA